MNKPCNPKTYDFISDPGHGWLKVPMMDLMASGVSNQISDFSYQTREFAFLEEDCDAGIFIEAEKARGVQIKFNEIEVPDFRIYLTRLGRATRFPAN